MLSVEVGDEVGECMDKYVCIYGWMDNLIGTDVTIDEMCVRSKLKRGSRLDGLGTGEKGAGDHPLFAYFGCFAPISCE